MNNELLWELERGKCHVQVGSGMRRGFMEKVTFNVGLEG